MTPIRNNRLLQQISGTRPQIAADDGPDACTSTLPTLAALAVQRSYAGALCISRDRLRSSQSFSATVAALRRGHGHRSQLILCQSACFVETVPRSTRPISQNARTLVQLDCAAEMSVPLSSRTAQRDGQATALDSFCPIAVRYPVATGPSAPSPLPLPPLQTNFSCEFSFLYIQFYIPI